MTEICQLIIAYCQLLVNKEETQNDINFGNLV